MQIDENYSDLLRYVVELVRSVKLSLKTIGYANGEPIGTWIKVQASSRNQRRTPRLMQE